MSENTIKINQIPSPTWNWLGMNEAIIDMGVVCSKDDDVKITLPDDIEASVKESDYGSDIKGAMGEVFDENLAKSAGSTEVLTLGDNVKCKTPVVISAEFKKECAGGKRFVIEAGRGSELTVLQDFSSEENASGRGCMQTLVSAGEGAKVKIIQIARLNGDYELLEPDSEEVFIYKRTLDGEHLMVICNFTDYEVTVSDAVMNQIPDQAEILIANYADDAGKVLRPYEAKVYRC